jgi:hypothetical protein
MRHHARGRAAWSGWLLAVVVAIAISSFSPRLVDARSAEEWRERTVYQIVSVLDPP